MCLNFVLIIVVVSVRIGYAMRLGLVRLLISLSLIASLLNSWRSA